MNGQFTTNVYDSTLDYFIPEFWANEVQRLLYGQRVIAQMVDTDYSPVVQQFGDTVNIQTPGAFVAKRKASGTSITLQDAVATNTAVVLNQQAHVAFALDDIPASLSLPDLRSKYLLNAANALSEHMDRSLLGQYPQFMGYNAGKLGSDGTTIADNIVDLRQAQQVALCPLNGRNLIYGPQSAAYALKLDKFTDADRIGDNGTALREASIGRRYGYDLFECQNMAEVSGAATTSGTTAAAASAGATTITQAATGAIDVAGVGHWFTVAGDMIPHRVTAGNDTTHVLTFEPALKSAVASGAVITHYTPAAVNLTDGYASGSITDITFDGSGSPKIGQFLTFGTSAVKYTIIAMPTASTLTLDRPLEAAVANDTVINLGPNGCYNLAFHREAMAVIARPLRIPTAGVRAAIGTIPDNPFPVRVTIGYDMMYQKEMICIDLLYGVKVLRPALGAVLFQ